jgi:hypothetical protein
MLIKKLCILFMVSLFGTSWVSAQDITGRKYLRIGELWHEDEDIPSGGWQTSFAWPGNRWRRASEAENGQMGGTMRECGMGFGLKNWKDYKGVLNPIVVGGVGSSLMVHPSGGKFSCINHEFKVILRRPPPKLIVDGELQPPRQDYDEIDPTLVSDAVMYIRWSYEIGLTAEQRYYDYAGKPFDCYLFTDFKVKNTGNMNRNENTIELKNQVLHDLYLNYAVLPQISYEGARQNNTGYEHYNDDWVEYYGENYLKFLGNGTPARPMGDPTADSLRIFMAWDGDNNWSPGIDDTGDPDVNAGFMEQTPGMGMLLSYQYFGMGLLHADKGADNETNDLSQPSCTVWRPGNILFQSPEEAYNFYFVGNHMLSPQEMGYTEPNDPAHVSRPNPYVCIGPYEMPFGSDIHFSMLFVVNGINYDLANSVGRSWWSHWKGGQGMTDVEKNRMVATGKDSLFKYYSQAMRRYFRNIEKGRDPYDVPEAPQPPDLSVTAAEKSVVLEWSDVSQIADFDTKVKDFAGYRVYRTLGRNDTTFTKIWECGGKSGVPVTTRYVDINVQRGFAYYYYVTAYDDGMQNWDRPGESLESGKYWNMMLKNKPVHPFMSGKPVPDLSNIKVVPNPYHDKSVQYNYPKEENKLMFINLPLKCTIKIYTANGELVRTIYHDDKTSEQAWNQVTESNQLIFSGVYIFYVESDQGTKVGKFVVVRSSRVTN